jgi:peptide deformylase
MILPITAYGDPVLKTKAKEIAPDYPKLKELIQNMFDTMYGAHGVGLAAPQVGLSIRLFVVDASPMAEDEEFTVEEINQLKEFKKVFINPQMLKISYVDENFVSHTEEYEGVAARIIQHEYDHIEGILFTDKLSSFKKRILKGKLTNISKGNIKVDYKMRFPLKK